MRQILLLCFLPLIRIEAINATAVNLQQLTLALNAYNVIVSFNKPDSFVVT